jgi:hypothetical protein
MGFFFFPKPKGAHEQNVQENLLKVNTILYRRNTSSVDVKIFEVVGLV